MLSTNLKEKVAQIFTEQSDAKLVLNILENLCPKLQNGENSPFVKELLSLHPFRYWEELDKAVLLATLNGINPEEYLLQLLTIAKHDPNKWGKLYLLKNLYLTLDKSKFANGWKETAARVLTSLKEKDIYNSWSAFDGIFSRLAEIEINDAENAWEILLNNIAKFTPLDVYCFERGYRGPHKNELSFITAMTESPEDAVTRLTRKHPLSEENRIKLIALAQHADKWCNLDLVANLYHLGEKT